jgi:hypothetical protein
VQQLPVLHPHDQWRAGMCVCQGQSKTSRFINNALPATKAKVIFWLDLSIQCLLNHMINSQVTYFKQFCKTKWSVCSTNTMLMKSYSDINPKLLKVRCATDTLVYLKEAGINATFSSFP